MKTYLSLLLLFFSLAGNAQLNLEWGSSISLGGSAYAPSLRVYQMGLSPQVGLYVEIPVVQWAKLRLGGALTLTQLNRPHFKNNFAYLGIPISMIIAGDPIGEKQAFKAVFMTRFHPAWQLGGPPAYGNFSPKSLTNDYRGNWGAGIGIRLLAAKRQQEILITGGLSSPLNSNYVEGGNIEPLLGTRIALEWNLNL